MPNLYDSPRQELAIKAEKARMNGRWFYNMQTKKWLTPEAYIDAGERDLLVHGEDSRITLDSFFPRDPREGIRDRIAYIRAVSVELHEFTESVFDYFSLLAKDEGHLKKKPGLRIERNA